MKSSMKMFVIGLLTIFTVSTIVAQRGQKVKANPEERAERQTNHMTKELSLSPEQAEQVAAINLEFANKSKDKASRKELRAEHKAALSEVLTPEQIAKWDTAKKGRKGKKGGKGKAKGISFKSKISPAERAERMTNRMNEELSLTAEQLEMVATINEEFTLATAKLHTNKTEKPDKSEMKSVREAHKSALQSVLTPSQLETWKATYSGGKCSKKESKKM